MNRLTTLVLAETLMSITLLSDTCIVYFSCSLCLKGYHRKALKVFGQLCSSCRADSRVQFYEI